MGPDRARRSARDGADASEGAAFSRAIHCSFGSGSWLTFETRRRRDRRASRCAGPCTCEVRPPASLRGLLPEKETVLGAGGERGQLRPDAGAAAMNDIVAGSGRVRCARAAPPKARSAELRSPPQSFIASQVNGDTRARECHMTGPPMPSNPSRSSTVISPRPHLISPCLTSARSACVTPARRTRASAREIHP